MASWDHIAERFVIHVFSGGGLTILTLTAWWWAERLFSWWPIFRGLAAFIIPLGVPLLIISVLEFGDVVEWGETKSYFDIASWMIGLGGSGYGLYRALPQLRRIEGEIRRGRAS